MAYEKQTWQTGDVITQEKLNHMEQGIEDGVNGYECTETTEELFEETVTPQVQDYGYDTILQYSAPITVSELIVTFDGTRYVCPNISPSAGIGGYGGIDPSTGQPDLSEYPFGIISWGGTNRLYARDDNTRTISCAIPCTEATTTPCFDKAVESVMGKFSVTLRSEGVYTSTMGYYEIADYAQKHGRFPVCYFLDFAPIPLFYAGRYVADEPPYADGYVFVGLVYQNGHAEIQSVIIKTNGDISVNTIQHPQYS